MPIYEHTPTTHHMQIRPARSEISFDPSEYAEDIDSDDDDVGVGRRRVQPSRSEMSFDPSVYAGDYDDDEFEGFEEDECGIGASLRVCEDGRAAVIGLVTGGPAERSGVLQVRDFVLRIYRHMHT